MKYKFGFIGVGNMGGALARAAAKSGETLAAADLSKEKANLLAAEIGCAAVTDTEAAKESKYVFMGIKPQYMADAISEIKETLRARNDRFILVTMAAGTAISKIKEYVGFDLPVIRIMPNMPAGIGKGVVLCSPDENVTEDEMNEFKELMSGAGLIDVVPESLIDVGCAVSGCGPAYVYMFIEALADGAVLCGLPRDKALKYAAWTVAGSAETYINSEKHPGELKDGVCSPGGTTIEGVAALENGAFRAACINAVRAGFDKSKKL